ncbi:hypothetical protein GCM10027403_24380 [Arthrobacter tecti]
MNQETLASGRYLLDRVIGAGGMADVYRARDLRLGRDVAVKMFRRGSAEGVARGSGEARMLAALHHPGLVRVLDMDAEGAASGPSYLVMEYIRGSDLGALLREGPLSPESTTTAGRDIARTLGYIHGRRIVHRDIKPSNVLIRSTEVADGDFSYLLTDFGIARFFESSRVTATGSLIGTATYFSPEQARGDSVGAPTDIYALGLVLIECLTGEPAFPGTGLESALARISRAPVIPESFGPLWHGLLVAMTLDDPAARPTAADVVRTLEALDPAATPRDAPTLTAVLLTGPPELAPPVGSPGTVTTTTPPPTRESYTGARTAGETAPAAAERAPRGPLAGPLAGAGAPPARVVIAVVLLAALAVACVVVISLLSAQPLPALLPAIPGTIGDLLEDLYESVQP